VTSRQLYSTGSVWEPIIGCSRAVRTGDHLAISACGPLAPDGKTTAAPDAYGQAKRCLAIIARVIADAGFSLDDVVKTRVYFKSYDDWEAIAKAHGEVFGKIRPANAFIQIAGFASPEWHVEIEADCQRSSGT
jgi:enamine deaminase RidA (YjgF/YER057c/UK114 family)